jgi:putative aldouronate transport system permease protein
VQQALLHVFFCLVSLFFILPVWTVVSVSITSDSSITNNGYQLIPSEISLAAYEHIFRNPDVIVKSYMTTIFISVVGTVLTLLICSLAAYALAMKDFSYRRIVNFYFFFTMLFSGGLIPSYILVTQTLHLKNSIWALIWPSVGSVWYTFLMRTFFRQLPYEMFEAARIDGAAATTVYSTIVLPLSTPILGVVGLFTLLGMWNSWMGAMLYISDKNMYPLQYLLQVMLRNVQEIIKQMQQNMLNYDTIRDLPTDSLRMAMCILAAGPMLVVFPFFQKYFAKGIIVGSVKG